MIDRASLRGPLALVESRFLPRGWSLAALAFVVFAYAFMGQATSGGPNSHLALVKALANGTADRGHPPPPATPTGLPTPA